MIKQRKPLKRKTRLKPKRSTPRKSGRVRDEAYLDAVRALPCYVCGWEAPSDPDHQGEHPYGRKANDDTAVPMCRPCHSKRTDGYIPFLGEGWIRVNKGSMRAWCDVAIAATRAKVRP